MNVCLFFEGTGQGVAGKITNVTRLYDACVADEAQALHDEHGEFSNLWGAFDRVKRDLTGLKMHRKFF